MTVRKAAGTTFWLIVLFAGVSSLIPAIRSELPFEIIYPIESQLWPGDAIESYFRFIVNLAIWFVVIVGTIDVILNSRCDFALLKSYKSLIILSIPIIIITYIPFITTSMFWCILQFTAILGTYWTFRTFIHNNYCSKQKLIPFVKGIRKTGGSPKGHIYDHYVVLGGAFLLLALYALQIITLLVFVGINWDSFV